MIRNVFVLFSMSIICTVKSVSVNAETYTVDSGATLSNRLAITKPGDTIYLESGEYPGRYKLKANASRENPILIIPKERDKVYFTGEYTLTGDGMVFDGIHFQDNGKLVVGDDRNHIDTKDIVIRNCTFDGLNSGTWLQIRESAKDIIVEHNLFANKKTKGQLLQLKPPYNDPMNHIIRRNYFFNIERGDGNGYETIQVGQEVEGKDRETNVLIEFNLFEEASGEEEIISVKTSRNIVQFNTFLRSMGSLTFRHGDNNLAKGNIFLGEGVVNTKGIRFQGEDHTITGNYMEGIDKAPLSIMDGESNPKDPKYPFYGPVVNAKIDLNVIINSGYLLIGQGLGGYNTDIPAENVMFTNNVIYRTRGSESFTKLVDTGSKGLSDDYLKNTVAKGNKYFGATLGDGFGGVHGFNEVFSIDEILDLIDFSAYRPLSVSDVGPYTEGSEVDSNMSWLVPVRRLLL
ncbi:polysaccharide lyase 6 family protein [Microbulbifer sp. THAF38]|uniref:polysaccharide lyase 6 family protein n=1 Tax=Microbulbifer sp. THAF38 TaxID=2587856 RepID=UPI0012686C1A|nr:polysaccharide lyase 6 family protein [Microbulbifer sp. THAF38]QFT54845.1 Chondroitinase-B precursor [Microbulbifer sp. THAF38]